MSMRTLVALATCLFGALAPLAAFASSTSGDGGVSSLASSAAPIPLDPCTLTCPPGSLMEQEPCGQSSNGGCGANPGPVFEPITCGDTLCGTAWHDATDGSRDTDWYELNVTQAGVLTWQVTAEFAPQMMLIDPGSGDCIDYSILDYTSGPECQMTTITGAVTAGTYWLWIAPDLSLNGDVICGDNDVYIMTVTCSDPGCQLDCPPGSVPEPEPCGQDTNGGCGAVPGPVFSPVNCGETLCGTAWHDAATGTRDTDWYELILTEAGRLTWQLRAEFAPQMMLIDAGSGDCLDYVVIDYGSGDECEAVTLTSVVGAGTYWLWIAPDLTLNGDVNCGVNDLYYMTVTCTDPNCDLTRPVGAVFEMEDCGLDLNGGCSSLPTPTFQPIVCGHTVGGTAWQQFGTGLRDTDWYEVTVTEACTLVWEVVAEFTPQAIIIDAGSGNCLDYVLIAANTGAACTQVRATADVDPGTYWLWVAPDLAANGDVICGDNDYYYATVQCAPPCDVTCPPGAGNENEPTCMDDYVDVTNGGCLPNGELALGTMSCDSSMCGESGNFLTLGMPRRDADVFELLVPLSGPFEFSVEAEFPVQILLMDPGSGNCSDYSILAVGTAGPCEQASISGTISAGTYWLWIGMSDIAGWPCGVEWVASVECPGSCPMANIDYAYVSPPDSAVDARINHPPDAYTPCYGIGMPGDPISICLEDPSATGGCDCFSLCETAPDANCGPNAIAACTDLGDGCYELTLAHGIAAPGITTIQYYGTDYVTYYRHPANVDGSTQVTLTDITVLIDNINLAFAGQPTPRWVTDIDVSGSIGLPDLLAEIDLFNGAYTYGTWANTSLPDPAGCP